MTNEEISRIIESLGYTPRLRTIVSPKGDGTELVYVYAWHNRASGKSLGSLKDVAQMSEDELRQLIAAKFPEEKEKH